MAGAEGARTAPSAASTVPSPTARFRFGTHAPHRAGPRMPGRDRSFCRGHHARPVELIRTTPSRRDCSFVRATVSRWRSAAVVAIAAKFTAPLSAPGGREARRDEGRGLCCDAWSHKQGIARRFLKAVRFHAQVRRSLNACGAICLESDACRSAPRSLPQCAMAETRQALGHERDRRTGVHSRSAGSPGFSEVARADKC